MWLHIVELSVLGEQRKRRNDQYRLGRLLGGSEVRSLWHRTSQGSRADPRVPRAP